MNNIITKERMLYRIALSMMSARYQNIMVFADTDIMAKDLKIEFMKIFTHLDSCLHLYHRPRRDTKHELVSGTSRVSFYSNFLRSRGQTFSSIYISSTKEIPMDTYVHGDIERFLP